jgi:hypothetical protein
MDCAAPAPPAAADTGTAAAAAAAAAAQVVPPINLLDSRGYVVNTLPTLSRGAVQHVLPGAAGTGVITGAVSGTLSLLDVRCVIPWPSF